MKPLIDHARLLTLLSYDPATGVFRWLTTRSRCLAGSIAGSRRAKDGYVEIMLEGRAYQAGRLAWFYVTGKWPKNEIDHKNTNNADNRFDNLRDVDHIINSQNKRRASPLSSTGLLGVYMNRGIPRARIQLPTGKRIDLGRFPSPAAAHEAYLSAKRQLHEGNTL